MPKKKKNVRSPLLEEIPSSRCEPEQVARFSYVKDAPTYKLLRNPFRLGEINDHGRLMALWRENGTLTYVSSYGVNGSPEYGQRYLSLNFYRSGLKMDIVGSTDDAIAETAAFFMSLEDRLDGCQSSDVILDTYGGSAIDFRAAGAQCFLHMFDVAPCRDLRLSMLKLSAEQSAALTRGPYSIHLILSQCFFEDEGTAFVGALLNRESNFGSLSFEESTGLSDENLKGLLQVAMIQYLSLPLLNNDELAIVAFTSQAKSLDYDISYEALRKADMESLHVATARLLIRVHYDSEDFPTELMLPFWRRVAALGHFENLSVRVVLNDEACCVTVPDCVVQEFIRAIVANSDLDLLAVSDRDSEVYWEPHLPTIFEGLKDHPGLRNLGAHVHNKDLAFGPDYCHLRQLLTRNRIIAVTNEFGDVYLDGNHIDKLYALNAFFRGSKVLSTEPPAKRSNLVATTLIKTASKNFKRSAFLLSNHADALCELVQFAKLDDLNADASSQSTRGTISKRNRGRKMRGRRDAKRK